MRALLLLLFALAASVAIGCSLRSLDYLTDRAPDAAAFEAGAEAGPPDAGAEAGRFCEAHRDAAFCDDFDDPSWSSNGWSGGRDNGQGHGTLDVTDATYVSPPHSLLGTATDTTGWNLLTQSLGPSTNHVVVDLDLGIDQRPATDLSVLVVAINPDDGGTPYTVELFADATNDSRGSLKVVEGPNNYTYHYLSTTPPEPSDGWTHVTLDVTFAPTPAVAVTLNRGSTPVLQDSITPTVTSGGRTVQLGLTYYTSSGWQVRFDNVVISTSAR